MDKPLVTIYTDGGAMPNPGPGGWGAVLIFEKGGETHTREMNGGEAETTNNRMELTAAIKALQALKQPCRVEFYTDSQYLKNGITEWMANWKRTNFKKGAIQNADLWQTLDAEVARHEITWHWVKGHAGHQYNELVDRLATAGRPGGAPPVEADKSATQAYLRVSSIGSPGPGAWGVLITQNGEETIRTGGQPKTNSNRLDLLAATAALEAVPEGAAIQVFTPNSYLYDGITKWINGWKKSGWQKKTGGPVLYSDLWQQLDRLAQTRRVLWVLVSAENRPVQLDRLEEPVKEAIETVKRMR